MADLKSAEVQSWMVKAYHNLQAAERLLVGEHPLTVLPVFMHSRLLRKR